MLNVNVNRYELIDSDECEVFLITCRRQYGKAFISVKVTNSGPYGPSENWTIIARIAANDFRHFYISRVPRTTTAI